MARRDIDEATAKVNQSSAKVQMSQTELTAMHAKLRAAKSMEKQAAAEVDAARAMVGESRAELAQAEEEATAMKSQSESASAGARSSRAMASYTELRALSNGVVTERLVSPGTPVMMGETVLKVKSDGTLRIQADLPQRLSNVVRVGSTVRITIDGETSEESVTSVFPFVDAMTRSFRIEALLVNILTRLKAEPGVKKAVFLPKEEALALLKKTLKGQESLMEGLGENPLPDSYEVTIDPAYADAAKIEVLTKRIGKLYGVEDVSYGRQGVEVLDRLLKLVTWGGITLAVLLGVTVVFIISNSVRLALYSRGQEIELMQWIGATRWFIMGPFHVEGMLVAVIGTSLAVGLLAGLFHALPREIVLFLSGPGGLDFLPTTVMAYMVGGGGALGFAGGLVSVDKFLE